MYVLLNQYVDAKDPAIQSGLASLIRRQLGDTLLFQHEPEEANLWLRAILDTCPSVRAAGVDADERQQTFLSFVDECVQRCLKTPYRYLDDWAALVASADVDAEAATQERVSPLLAAVLEQLDAKVTGKLLAPTDVLGVAAFLRRLVFTLATARFDLVPLVVCAQRLETMLSANRLSTASPLVDAAARREGRILSSLLAYLRDGPGADEDMTAEDSDHDTFLLEVERAASCMSSQSIDAHLSPGSQPRLLQTPPLRS
jgi:nucleolar pre-ribosomal-associated protein 1